MSFLEPLRRLFRPTPPPLRQRRVTLCCGEAIDVDGVMIGVVTTARDSADLFISSRNPPTRISEGPAT